MEFEWEMTQLWNKSPGLFFVESRCILLCSVYNICIIVHMWHMFDLLDRLGACPHGHLHRTGHSLLQVQAPEDERTSRVVLVQSQHSKGRHAPVLHYYFSLYYIDRFLYFLQFRCWVLRLLLEWFLYNGWHLMHVFVYDYFPKCVESGGG